MANRSNTILVLNGPNLNRLGLREPGIYGSTTLADIERLCERTAASLGVSVECAQSNTEGTLVDRIHDAADRGLRGIAFNAGAYTHTSIALHDAIRSVDVPVVEVHISNVHAREPFRHHSMIAAACRGVVCGFGATSYVLALHALAESMEGTA